MERWQNCVAVVTGASSGIGSAVVVDLANAGLIVVGLARRVEKVTDLKEKLSTERRSKLHAVHCDVSSEESVTKAFDWIEKNVGGIDILVNNAGTLAEGCIVDMSTTAMLNVFKTNVMGVIYCTQRAFRSMKQRKFDGHVVVINSIVGHKLLPPQEGQPPRMNVYPATKHAVTALTEMYRQEFMGLNTGIKITSISPGVVDTEIIPDYMKDFIGNRMMKSEDISQAVLFTIATPPRMQIHEMIIKPAGELF